MENKKSNYFWYVIIFLIIILFWNNIKTVAQDISKAVKPTASPSGTSSQDSSLTGIIKNLLSTLTGSATKPPSGSGSSGGGSMGGGSGSGGSGAGAGSQAAQNPHNSSAGNNALPTYDENGMLIDGTVSQVVADITAHPQNYDFDNNGNIIQLTTGNVYDSQSGLCLGNISDPGDTDVYDPTNVHYNANDDSSNVQEGGYLINPTTGDCYVDNVCIGNVSDPNDDCYNPFSALYNVDDDPTGGQGIDPGSNPLGDPGWNPDIFNSYPNGNESTDPPGNQNYRTVAVIVQPKTTRKRTRL